MGLRFQPRSLLTLLFITIFAYVVIEAWNMPVEAKMYPWAVSIIALVLLAWQLVREILPTTRVESHETGADMDFTEDEASSEGKRRTLEMFIWIYGFAAFLWLLGFYVAIPLMVFLYLVRHRESSTLTVVLPTIAGGLTWGVFGYFLHLPFPPGILLEMAGLS